MVLPHGETLALQSRELILRGRCGACAEWLPAASLLRADPCPACGEGVEAHWPDPGALLDTLEGRIRRQRTWVSLGLALAILPFAAFPLVGSLGLLGAYLWLRLRVLAPLAQFLPPRRRLVTRWTGRILLATTLVVALLLGELLTLLPGLSLILKGVVVFLKVWLGSWALTRYFQAQARRELRGEPIRFWEWLIPLGSLLLFFLGTAGVFLALYRITAFLQGALPHLGA